LLSLVVSVIKRQLTAREEVERGMEAEEDGVEEREDEKGRELEFCKVANGQIEEITL